MVSTILFALETETGSRKKLSYLFGTGLVHLHLNEEIYLHPVASDKSSCLPWIRSVHDTAKKNRSCIAARNYLVTNKLGGH